MHVLRGVSLVDIRCAGLNSTAWKLSPGRYSRSGWGFSFVRNNARAPPPLDATGLSQQEVFKDEFALATDKRFTANTAEHFLKDGLRTSFDFDNESGSGVRGSSRD